MADLESTLSGILSDPEAVRKLQELGKSLGLTDKESPPPQSQPANSNPLSGIDLSSVSSLSSLLGFNSSQNTETSDFMGKLKSFLPLLSNMNKEDETTALLKALRPFLSQSRQKRLDDASKMLRVMHILPLISSAGLF